MQESQKSEVELLKEEIRSLEESLSRLGQRFIALEKENEELQAQAQISRTEVHMHVCYTLCIHAHRAWHLACSLWS